MIDYDRLKAHVFEPVVQRYDARDCMLYALGLNLGQDPLDPADLEHVAMVPPRPVVSMPMTLGRIGAWMRDPAVGIDYRRIMVGEVALRLHAPLPPEAEIASRHAVVSVTDKGEGRGALVGVNRRITDRASGLLLAEYHQLTFCRADGGFAKDGRHDALPATAPWQRPASAPDLVRVLPTSPRQALIYRLSGDMNPLHSDPKAAQAAGFARPILHGLSTMGMAAHALDRAAAQEGLRLGEISARLSAPVIPGQILTLQAWRAGRDILFEMQNPEGVVVLAQGRAAFAASFLSHSNLSEIAHDA